MLKPYIAKVMQRQNLNAEEAESAMQIIMTGQATPAQIGGYLVALRMKGETVEEITGSASAMRTQASHVPLHTNGDPLLDTAGTGGDGAHTFNISTAAAFVVAGTGRKVAKHGNRAASSSCGSADVLGALGVNLDLTSEQVAECIEQVGIGFMFAPKFHPAMKYAIGPRRELGQRTIFNLLGPLTNPAGAEAQLLGVGNAEKAPILAEALAAIGVKRGMVVHGEDGMDEISTTSPTRVWEIGPDGISSSRYTPEELGIAHASIRDLAGGGAEANARIIREEVLAGREGPRRDVATLNAAAALLVAGVAGDLKEGIEMAAHSIDSGAASGKLEALAEFTSGGA
jgi:anthranilate phosphoribosyltransferase